MKINSAGINPKISDRTAFIVIIIAGALVAWFTINAGEKIINNAPNSEIFGANQMMQNELNPASKPQASKKE